MAAMVRRVLVVLGLGVSAMVLLAGPAAAQTACSATANGRNVATLGSPGDALEVDAKDRVTIVVTSAGAAFTSYDVKLEFAGVGWTAASGSANGPTWTDQVKVDDYASKGVGLYKVVATSTLQGGGTCSTVAYVKVTGKGPLSTTAGQVAAGAAVLGLAGTAVAGARALRGMAPVLAAPGAEAVGYRRTEDGGLEPTEVEPTPLGNTVPLCMPGFCSTVAIAAVGLTLAAMVSEAAHSVVATLGRIHR